MNTEADYIKSQEPPSLQHVMVVEQGVPTEPPERKRKTTQVNPEQLKLQKLFEKVYALDCPGSSPFWTPVRRRVLEAVSERIFFFCAVSGYALLLLGAVWHTLLKNMDSVYNVTTTDSTSSPPAQVNVLVRSPFIQGIKKADEAFAFYYIGVTFLMYGAGICFVASQNQVKQRKQVLYFCAIPVLLIATLFMVAGPLFPIKATNTQTEIQLLNQDEYLAFQKAVRGSIKYFNNNGQCLNVNLSVMGKDADTTKLMKNFCDFLLRLMVILYVMWGTTLIPLLALVMTIVQIIVNKKNWDVTITQEYKERTPEQQEFDRCVVD